VRLSFEKPGQTLSNRSSNVRSAGDPGQRHRHSEPEIREQSGLRVEVAASGSFQLRWVSASVGLVGIFSRCAFGGVQLHISIGPHVTRIRMITFRYLIPDLQPEEDRIIIVQGLLGWDVTLRLKYSTPVSHIAAQIDPTQHHVAKPTTFVKVRGTSW